MKKFLLLSACLCGLFARTVNFNTVLNEALNNNLELKAKKLNIDKAKADLKKAKAYNWGTLSLDEEISRTNDALYVFGMKLESREATFRDFGFSDFLAAMQSGNMAGILSDQPRDLNYPGSRSNFKTKLVYNVPLFTGFKLKYAKEMAALQVKANKYKYSHDRNKLAVEVLKAYNGAVAAKYFISALKKAKQTADSFVKIVKEFYKEGMATKIDLLEAKKRENKINAMLIKAENKYQLAISYLRFLTDDNTIDNVGDFKIIYPPNKSLKQLIEFAMKHRNDLKWMRENLLTMQKNVKMKESAYYPTIGAHLEYGYDDDHLTLSAKKNYYLAAVGMNWKLFDPVRSATVQKSKIDALQTEYYYQYMKKAIALQVKQKYLNFEEKAAIIKEKLTNKILANEILQKYIYMYKQGMINFTTLLMKEADARKATAELIKARYEEALAAAQLEEAIGDLLKESK